MSGQVVVNTAECGTSDPDEHCLLRRHQMRRCEGCMSNGRRVLLDTAIPVEARSYYVSAMDQLDCWVEVER